MLRQVSPRRAPVICRAHCFLPVKHWDAHTASKQHKTSLQRVKQEQEKERAKARRDQERHEAAGPSSKRQRVEATDTSSAAGPSETSGPAQEATVAVDSELDAFLSSLNDEPPEVTPAEKARKPYKVSEQESQTTYEAAPAPFQRSRKPQAGAGQDEEAGEEEEEEEEESEAARRARLAREEREEIMDRLEEETRAQEDADERVQHLRARLEAVKRLRAQRQRHGTNQ